MRASGRTAQTAATQGRPVRVRHSWARSIQRQGPAAASIWSTGFEGEQRGVADEERGVGVGEHGDGVGGCGEELGIGADEFAEEDLRVGEGTAGGGVGGDGADCARASRLRETSHGLRGGTALNMGHPVFGRRV